MSNNDLSIPCYLSATDERIATIFSNSSLYQNIPCSPIRSSSLLWEELQRKEAAFLTLNKQGLKVALIGSIYANPIEATGAEIEKTFWDFIDKELLFGDYSPDPCNKEDGEIPRFKGLMSYVESVSHEILVFEGGEETCFEAIADYVGKLNATHPSPFLGGVLLFNQRSSNSVTLCKNAPLTLHSFYSEEVEARDWLVHLYQPGLWDWRGVMPIYGMNTKPHRYDTDEASILVMLGAPVYEGVIKTVRVKMA